MVRSTKTKALLRKMTAVWCLCSKNRQCGLPKRSNPHSSYRKMGIPIPWAAFMPAGWLPEPQPCLKGTKRGGQQDGSQAGLASPQRQSRFPPSVP